MFDRTLRELQRLQQGVHVSVSLPVDDKGYLDRRCPADMCGVSFKVLFEDWRDLVRDEVVHCPICRHEASSGEWNTEEQKRYLEKVGLAYVERAIGSALSQDAQSFNRRQPRGGFIQMSMSFKPGAHTFVLPIEAAEAMEQGFVCESCGCQYSSVGAAFFCPACGHNSATTTFDNAVETVIRTMSAVPQIRETIQENFGADAAEDTTRHLIEGSLGKLVSSFQRFAEATFARLPNAAQFTPRKNVFQNLGESNKLWLEASGKSYEDMLTLGELADLKRLFEQRHLLAHKEGIVDEDYINKTGDRTYSLGQRLVVREASVSRLIELVRKLAEQLRQV